jgi:prepilin-type N-terminal cleavage/methylation domain-containing protein
VKIICASRLVAGRFQSEDRRHERPLPKSAIGNRQSAIAFTLIELLVVISIMGLIAALTVPALKSLGKSNLQTSASRQMLDDIGRARQLAISQHTTVYMVFVPTNFINLFNVNGHNIMSDLNNSANFPSVLDQQTAVVTASNLMEMQLSGYNFISLGQVGDQPGQHAWHYLSTWQSLPQGTFIAAAKFLPQNSGSPMQIPAWQSDYGSQIDTWFRVGGTLYSQIIGFTNRYVPFPTEKSPPVPLPYLAFDYTGRLISEFDGVNYHHAYIPLAQGSVSYGYDANKQPTLTAVPPNAITETPVGNSSSISYNVIDVDPLSGRAKLLYHHLPQ